jgi:hypothetical protein
MLRALAIKELRETGLVALAALALYACLVSSATGFRLLPLFSTSGGTIPFVGDAFLSSFVWISAGLAIALGFRQSVLESMQSTYLFLLHRPAPRWRLIAVKLAVGLVLYLVSAALPVLLYAWWAATPGTHASPFEWSMTFPTWKVWSGMTAVYFAAFLCGIRPAHWLWSRLWPLAGAGVLVFLIQFLPCWSILGPGAVVLLDAALVTAVFTVSGSRDYP